MEERSLLVEIGADVERVSIGKDAEGRHGDLLFGLYFQDECFANPPLPVEEIAFILLLGNFILSLGTFIPQLIYECQIFVDEVLNWRCR